MKLENIQKATQIQDRLKDLTEALALFETQQGTRTIIAPVFICTRPKRQPKTSERLPECVSDELSEKIREYLNAEILTAREDLARL